MIELTVIFFLLSYFLIKKKPISWEFTGFKAFYLAIISAIIFYLSLQLASRNPGALGEFARNYFYFIHFICLLVMGVGFWPKEFNWKFSIYSIGFILNGISVLIHKKMPIDLNKLQILGQFDKINMLTRGQVLTHRPLISTDFYWLSDIFIYHPPWSQGKVVSLGDFFISIGLGILLSAYLYKIKGAKKDV